MKISELMERLGEIQGKEGDLEVVIYETDEPVTEVELTITTIDGERKYCAAIMPY